MMGLPIMHSSVVVHPLMPTLSEPEVPIRLDESKITYFHMQGNLEILQLEPFNNACGAKMCSGANLYDGAKPNLKKCTCYNKGKGNTCSISFKMRVNVTFSDGTRTVVDFIDEFTQSLYMIKNLEATKGLTAAHIDTHLRNLIKENTNKTFDLFGKWWISGWFKPGLIEDHASKSDEVAGPYQTKAKGAEVLNSELKIHICRIVPVEPTRVDLAELEVNRVDIREEMSRKRKAMDQMNNLTDYDEV